MKKLGIAISVYDKVEQTIRAINYIYEWKIPYEIKIKVGSANELTLNSLKKKFNSISIIKINTLKVLKTNFLNLRKNSLRIRQRDSINQLVTSMDTEYTVHFHGDAFITKPNELLNIINLMIKKKKYVAFRGLGINKKTTKTYFGDIDDHFIIFNNDEIKKRNLFKSQNFFSISSLLLNKINIESYLSWRINKKFNLNELYHYDDFKNNIVSSLNISRDMNPYNLDCKRDFYHINDNSDFEKLKDRITK